MGKITEPKICDRCKKGNQRLYMSLFWGGYFCEVCWVIKLLHEDSTPHVVHPCESEPVGDGFWSERRKLTLSSLEASLG